MRKYSVIFLFCALFFSNRAYSKINPNAELGVYGAGMMLCEEWIENDQRQRDFTAEAWVAGAYTGYENACRLMGGNCVNGKLTDMSQLYLRAKAYCRMNPNKRIADSALGTWLEIVKDPNSL
ncbi:hypothetical protein [Gluconobacter roseus]|uniref:Uncharacterized protein n=1 Tax=Gluconobacter roseus NBRC 3990 TaxID=1307950 RepID=A0A4Y3M5N5_9PROT|nr:hypothetical protein [Gluconobacter roseus]GBR43396.1 hypothetical protein AA3990_0412 [Gluconobacter roseus NBRC 3990]GEB03945.1 hypothetical protein GRO01_15210 [Gluconobacter roseus NBRC 3990]GLP94398.1 hypothetical protein GCM10007871_23760 [Gluconobacter roseus NBRC 3990]